MVTSEVLISPEISPYFDVAFSVGLETNVVVAGLRSRTEASAVLLDLAEEGEFRLVVNAPLGAEAAIDGIVAYLATHDQRHFAEVLDVLTVVWPGELLRILAEVKG